MSSARCFTRPLDQHEDQPIDGDDLMASNWIKMRVDLHTHPKVVRISSALNADRLRVVGGLHAVWCLFDAHSEDGSLEGYSPEVVDSLIGFPGFSRAMEKVGWLVCDGESVALPRFDDHNGKSAKRRAAESDRKREERESAKRPESVRKTSACDADKMRTREEKRREEKKESKDSSPLPPDGLDLASWDRWVAYRVGIKKPLKPASIETAMRAMAAFGGDQAGVVQQSIANGWQGLFPLKHGHIPRQGNHSGFDGVNYNEGIGDDGAIL